MKTSKKIFVTLLISVAVFILAVFIDIRLSGVYRGNDLSTTISQKEVLSQFSVISAVNSINITIVQGDSSFIELSRNKDSIPLVINYKVINDTLIIKDMRYPIQSTGFDPIRIHTTNSLSEIVLKNSEVSLQGYGSGKLSVNLDNSSAWFSQVKSSNQHFTCLTINAKNNSRANSNNFRVDSLSIFLENSKSSLQISAGKMYGILSDSSNIGLPQPGELYFKSDSTSTIRIY